MDFYWQKLKIIQYLKKSGNHVWLYDCMIPYGFPLFLDCMILRFVGKNPFKGDESKFT